MAKIINFDELKRLHAWALAGGTGSKAWIEFVTTMVDSFPALYDTASAMNAEIKSTGHQLYEAKRLLRTLNIENTELFDEEFITDCKKLL